MMEFFCAVLSVPVCGILPDDTADFMDEAAAAACV